MMFWLACMFSVDLVKRTRDFGWLLLRANRYPYFIMEILLRVHIAYTDMRFFELSIFMLDIIILMNWIGYIVGWENDGFID